MTPAEVLLAKLNASKIPGAKAPSISSEKALTDFSKHLGWLLNRHVTKPYSQTYLAGWVFGTKRSFDKKSEADGYCRANLVVAKRCFDDLIKNIRGKNNTVRHRDLIRYQDLIKDYVIDVKPIAEHLERQKDPNYSLFSGGRSYGVHTWEVFRVSQQLAVQSAFRAQPLHMDHKTAQIASVFVLRQALEAKFFRIIAVEIYDKNGNTPKLKHLFHYDFIVKNPAFFNFKAVAFTDLKKVYGWCNDVVHRVYHPIAWELDFAHEICRGLFVSLSVPSGARWSINNAVEIKNCNLMQYDFIAHFTKSYDHGIWAVEAIKPEALCI